MGILTTTRKTLPLNAEFRAKAPSMTGSSLFTAISIAEENERFEDCLVKWAQHFMDSKDAKEQEIGLKIEAAILDCNDDTKYGDNFYIKVGGVMLNCYSNWGWWRLGAHHSAVNKLGADRVLEAVTNLVLRLEKQ